MQMTEKQQLPPLILEFTPLRHRSSSFEERESRGSSSNPCACVHTLNFRQEVAATRLKNVFDIESFTQEIPKMKQVFM